MKRLLLILSFVCLCFSNAFGMKKRCPENEKYYRAIETDDFETFQKWFDYNKNDVDFFLETYKEDLLIESAKKGAYRCFCILVSEANMDVNLLTDKFGQPLIILTAIEKGQHRIVEILLNQGAEVGFEYEGKTCIEIGKKSKYPKIRKIFDHVDSLLTCVLNNDHLELRRLLRIAPQDFVNKILHNFRYKGDTLLHMAARKNNPNIVKILFNHGISNGVKNTQGMTPFKIADAYRLEHQDDDGFCEDTMKIFLAVEGFSGGSEDQMFKHVDELEDLGLTLNARPNISPTFASFFYFFPSNFILGRHARKFSTKRFFCRLEDKSKNVLFNLCFAIEGEAFSSEITLIAKQYFENSGSAEKRGLFFIEFLLEKGFLVDGIGFIGLSIEELLELEMKNKIGEWLCPGLKEEDISKEDFYRFIKVKIKKDLLWILFDKYRQRRKHKKTFVGNLCKERKDGEYVDSRIVVK